MITFKAIEPVVLTPEETCTYLRLDVGRDMDKALRALRRLVDEKKAIKPCMYTDGRMFLRAELDRFLDSQQK